MITLFCEKIAELVQRVTEIGGPRWRHHITMYLCQTPYMFFGTSIATNFTFRVWVDYPANDK